MVYDFIIVGGEAIGLYLGLKLAQQGRRILILEQKPTTGDKVCSGLVSSHIFDFFPKDWTDKFIERAFDGASINVEKSSYFFKGQAFIINRVKLNQIILGEFLKNGGEINFNAKVLSIAERNDDVKVEVIVNRNPKVFFSKIVAGADGVMSLVRKTMGVKAPEFLLGCMVHSFKDIKDNYVDLYFGRRFPGYFGWRIPRVDDTEWGIALLPRHNPADRLNEFLKERNVEYSNFQAALIPMDPIKRTTSKRLFVLGDAAGQVKPYSGGGLIYGFTAADIAAKVINPDNPDLSLYEKGWRKALGSEIVMGNILKSCYHFPGFIKKAGLCVLSHVPQIDQDRPLTILRNLFGKSK